MGVGRLLRWCLSHGAAIGLNPRTALMVPVGLPRAGSRASPGGSHDIYGGRGYGEYAVLRG